MPNCSRQIDPRESRRLGESEFVGAERRNPFPSSIFTRGAYVERDDLLVIWSAARAVRPSESKVALEGS